MCIAKSAEHPEVSAQASTIAVSSLHFHWFITWFAEQLKTDLFFSVAVAAGCASSLDRLVFSGVGLICRKMFKGILKEAICLAH